MNFGKRAFTLIELLIVVAIIAILAAIAVPNFLEAQVRSKVSRAKADQRSLTTALESYFVDNNKYPPNDAGPAGGPVHALLGGTTQDVEAEFFLIPLSTPIAYITTGQLLDPFGNRWQVDRGGNKPFLYLNVSQSDVLANFVITSALTGMEEAQEALFELRFMLFSVGPDRQTDIQAFAAGPGGSGDPADPAPTDYAGFLATAGIVGIDPYDPTNGTVSSGDIIRTIKGVFEKNHLAL